MRVWFSCQSELRRITGPTVAHIAAFVTSMMLIVPSNPATYAVLPAMAGNRRIGCGIIIKHGWRGWICNIDDPQTCAHVGHVSAVVRDRDAAHHKL